MTKANDAENVSVPAGWSGETGSRNPWKQRRNACTTGRQPVPWPLARRPRGRL